MPGTVTIAAKARTFGRAGLIRVQADGRVVGRVRQGGCLEITVESGEHTFRVTSGVTRSTTVALRVPEGGRLHLETGVRSRVSAVLALLAGICGAMSMSPPVQPVPLAGLAMILVGVMAVPDSLLSLRVTPTQAGFDVFGLTSGCGQASAMPEDRMTRDQTTQAPMTQDRTTQDHTAQSRTAAS